MAKDTLEWLPETPLITAAGIERRIIRLRTRMNDLWR